LEKYVNFVDESDPTKEIISEIEAKAAQNHWKAATRKLKKLTRQFPDNYVDEAVFLRVLETCMENRLQGARASEPARKIMEQLVEQGYYIPEKEGNYCIQNSLGETGPNSTHQGFGGIDTALAMVAAMEKSQTPIHSDTYEKLVIALAKEGSVGEALAILRREVVEMSVTPPLATFAAVARFSLMTDKDKSHADHIFTLLAYAKASGYELDTIAATEEGRSLLASGVIAADRVGNDAIGFRLLKAASNAKGVAPDRGDTMVALSSSAAQRACTLIHKRAVIKAVEDGEWQLAVKVLELMLQRFLKPSPWVWRNVVTCCAKAEKSKKATGLLLDWVKLSEQGKIEKPPLSVFNTCVNACEICNEQDLTLVVLDSMKKTHETDGNLITFNIALKRLAKLGNYPACEGIIVGMLQAAVEPSVVSYTTAIAACASSEVKQPATAYEWLRRMRSRNVQPNVITYNTALAACADGTIEGSFLGSKIAKEMLTDVDKQLQEGDEADELDEYRNVIPDDSTKVVARRLMQQLKQNWNDGAIDKRVATETIRVPLLQLIDFQKSEAAERARQQAVTRRKIEDEDEARSTKRVEIELVHRVAEV
jgi:PPR repeat family